MGFIGGRPKLERSPAPTWRNLAVMSGWFAFGAVVSFTLARLNAAHGSVLDHGRVIYPRWLDNPIWGGFLGAIILSLAVRHRFVGRESAISVLCVGAIVGKILFDLLGR